MQVERVDFVAVPTRDPERSRTWYREVLGLPADPNNEAEVAAGQVTLAFWNPESDGIEFSPNLGGIGLRVADVAAARTELEARGVEFEGTMDTGVCHMAFCRDPDGNYVILHRRYKPYAH
jgi:catechol 2,3-dioxygenase-like lactoylglutathione lyase family enzyme